MARIGDSVKINISGKIVEGVVNFIRPVVGGGMLYEVVEKNNQIKKHYVMEQQLIVEQLLNE